MASKRIRTNINLEPMTIGMLHYMLEVGESDTMYELIDVLVNAFAEHYAEENEISFDELKEEAIARFQKSRRPLSQKSKLDQERSAKMAMGNLRTRGKSNDILGGKVIKDVDEPTIDGGF